MLDRESRVPLSSREVLKALNEDGWYEVATRGSHVQLKHPTKAGRVTVPHPNKDLDRKTIRSIERQAEVRLLDVH
jgi:predicted RNA binding protein YcfA (HicA-like mRNA interferase family)